MDGAQDAPSSPPSSSANTAIATVYKYTDGPFIAAANPAAIIALLDRLKEADEKIKVLNIGRVLLPLKIIYDRDKEMKASESRY